MPCGMMFRITGDMLEQVQTQSSRAADGAQHAADAARHTADRLSGQEAWMAGLVEQGADRLGDFARTLHDRADRLAPRTSAP